MAKLWEMKNIFVAFLSLIIGAYSAQAQANSKGSEVLTKVFTKAKSYETIELDLSFELKIHPNGVDTTMRSILKIKGNKFLLFMDRKNLICDGINIYMLDTVKKEAEVDELKYLDSTEVWPFTMLTFYQYGFTKNATGVKKDEQGRSIMIIEVLPEKTRKFKYLSARICVDTDKSDIVKITLRGKSGEETSFIIHSIKANEVMDDKMFEYDKIKYKDYN